MLVERVVYLLFIEHIPMLVYSMFLLEMSCAHCFSFTNISCHYSCTLIFFEFQALLQMFISLVYLQKLMVLVGAYRAPRREDIVHWTSSFSRRYICYVSSSCPVIPVRIYFNMDTVNLQWEEHAWKGHLRYDVSSCQMKVLFPNDQCA